MVNCTKCKGEIYDEHAYITINGDIFCSECEQEQDV